MAGEEGPKGRPSRRLADDTSGVAAIEFAILALPFFLIVFAIIEISLTFLGELTLDQSVDRVGRMVRTGQIQSTAMSKEDFRREICDGVDFLFDCSKLQIDLQVYADFSLLPPPSPVRNGDIDPSGFDYKLGGPETISALRVYYKWPVHTDLMRAYLSNMKDGTHLLFSMAAFRTEPF